MIPAASPSGVSSTAQTLRQTSVPPPSRLPPPTATQADRLIGQPRFAYRSDMQAYIDAEQAQIKAWGLTQKAGNQSFVRFHQGPAPKGVIVLLHGFSAGTAQWHAYVDELFNRGYDVFVPALPGHGLVNKAGEDDV